MMRYAAFLRAINVGGRYVKMDVLRSVLAHADGLRNVQTYIASGNLIFEADGAPAEIERTIETSLQAGLGFEVPTFVRSGSELRAAASLQPFGADAVVPQSALMISFMRAAPSEDAVEKLMGLQSEADLLHVERREMYWLRLPSELPVTLSNINFERILGPATMRNMNTVRALLERYFADSDEGEPSG